MNSRVGHAEDTELLHNAFRSFDQAAATLQESYAALTARIERLDMEVAASNEALRKNLEEKEEIRRHLTAVLESLSTGVLVANEEGMIVRANQTAATLIRAPRESLIGRSLVEALQEAGLDGRTYPVSSPGGVPLSVSHMPVWHEDGVLGGSLALLHDISDVRRLEDRLQRRDRLAAMGEMVGRIAHEIRNPLGSVELFASMLRRDLAEHPGRRYAEHISVAVQAMDRLLSNLLAYTKPGRPRSAWHDPEAIVRDALTLAAHVIAQAPIETQVHRDAAVGQVWCDAAQITQALLNLILNAAQTMPGGGRLTIAIAPDWGGAADQAAARIAVTDTGPGIDPAHLSRIFDPFFTTRDEGTGLGLAIVHAIADAHQGRVEVDSRPGEGSTFTLIVPSPMREEPMVKEAS
jgi:signal transduction histidine kinase